MPSTPFAVPKSKASIDQNRFTFTLPDAPKKVWSVPLLKFLPVGVIEGLGDLNDVAGMLGLFDAEGKPELSQRVRRLSADQLEPLLRQWAEDSGIDLGESPASSGS